MIDDIKCSMPICSENRSGCGVRIGFFRINATLLIILCSACNVFHQNSSSVEALRNNGMYRIILTVLFILVMVLNFDNAFASIVIGNTRVIYNAGAKEVTVGITNRSSAPVLVQSWMDDGDARTNPALSKVPFVIVPPITRVDAQGRQALRISIIDETNLPPDRESLFWLNVLDVPVKPTASESMNRLQVALQSRIKLFYRPEGLRGSPEMAVRELIWQSNESGVSVRNPGVRFVSLISITSSTGVWGVDMVEPGESQQINAPIKPKTPILIAWIDDNGATQFFEAITK